MVEERWSALQMRVKERIATINAIIHADSAATKAERADERAERKTDHTEDNR